MLADRDPTPQGSVAPPDDAPTREGSSARRRRSSGPAPASPARYGDQYRVLGQLGAGGMGNVYLAHDERLDRTVAIKVLLPEVARMRGARERFRNEARAMARIRHPHVVGVYAFGEEGGLPYLVMEHVPGTPLYRWAELRGGLPLRLDCAIAILDQVCRGVSAIHASGLVHRDLKPGNVLVGPAGRVAVADFGLAAAVLAEREHGEAWCTPGYGAPELVDGAELPPALRTRADVFSAGVIAYELLTGRLPFPTTLELALHMADQRAPAPPSALSPGLPPAIDAAIMGAIELVPERRTRSIETLRRALVDAAESAQRPPSAPRVVVVDDDPEYRELVARTLGRAVRGARIETCDDGAAALGSALREPPDLLVADLDMPGLDGASLVRALRADERSARVPVLVASACGSSTDWSLLRELGADAFVAKPFEASQLAIAARGLLNAI